MIKSMTVGVLATNCYLLTCERTHEALIIDPGFSIEESSAILDGIRRSGAKVKYIVNTHGHFDHISGNRFLKDSLRAELLIHADDACILSDPRRNLSYMLGLNISSPKPDRLLKDGEKIEIGELRLTVMHTPGHTEGSISLLCIEENAVFTGDTLFAGSVGRTDLPGASLRKLLKSLNERLLKLPDETIVYPGHGEKTTIGQERKANPFLNLNSSYHHP